MSAFKETIENTEELARKIWLAGIGVYGQSFDNLQGSYEKLNDSARKNFDDLVSRGEKLEAETKDKLKTDKLKEKAEELKEKAEDFRSKNCVFEKLDLNLNDRLTEIRSKVTEKIKLPSIELPTFGNSKIDELKEQIEELNKTVSKMAKAPAKRPAAKKAAPKAAAATA